MKIKICGLTQLCDIEYVNAAGIDFAGFIFAQNSKRKISFERACEMKKALNPNIKTVGVFVNEEISTLCDFLDIIDLIQLHGDEENDYVKELKKQTNKEIIKAFRADENLKKNIDNAQSDYVLIDSYEAGAFGGTGKPFDLGLIPKTDKKIFLAGGITVQNVIEAVKKVHPYCIDINSGVETNGRKDRSKIMEITAKIKGYENE